MTFFFYSTKTKVLANVKLIIFWLFGSGQSSFKRVEILFIGGFFFFFCSTASLLSSLFKLACIQNANQHKTVGA